MTDASGTSLPLASCPLLGLPGDARTHYSFTNAGHRCHARMPPTAISTPHQASFCLSPNFPACEWYQSWQAREPALATAAAQRGEPTPGSGRLLAAAASAGPVGPWAMGPTGRRRRGGRKTAGLLALVLLAFLALGGAAASGLLPVGPGRSTGLSPTARPPATPSLTAVATPSPVASAEPSPSPSAVPTSPPTASPGRSSSPAASPTRTHIVQTGEWLSSIAEEYGTTVERLAELNDIDDPDVIDTGQVLVIPPVEEP